MKVSAAQVGAMFFCEWTFRSPAHCLDSVLFKFMFLLNQVTRRIKREHGVLKLLTGRGEETVSRQVKQAKLTSHWKEAVGKHKPELQTQEQTV